MATIPQIDRATRKQISEFIPKVLSKTLNSYISFIFVDPGINTKSFHKHHSAAKVAVAHVMLLLHLASWAYEDDDAQAELGLASMIAAAHAELAGRDHAGQ